VYAKKDSYDILSLEFRGLGSTPDATFNLSSGTVASGTGAIQSVGNGWYRCSVTKTSVDTFEISIIGVGTSPTTGNSIFIWGAQLEAGSFATSYIPTTTASVIRSADVCSITGSDFSGFYNPLEGSLSASAIFNAPLAGSTGQIIIDVNDTTASNRTRFIRNGSTGFLQYANTVGGTQDVTIAGSTAMITGAVTKLAGCMKANDFTIYLNNVSQGVDTTCVMQTAPTTFTIGDVSSGLATRAFINGTISSIRYYRKRLPNAKLQALTV
jgi:hypothetical protein